MCIQCMLIKACQLWTSDKPEFGFTMQTWDMGPTSNGGHGTKPVIGPISLWQLLNANLSLRTLNFFSHQI